MAEQFVTAELVADHLGLSTSLIRKSTTSGSNPIPHHRIPGGRSVRYLLSEVHEWIRKGGTNS
jgi:predicted DNA-binding transcriptional regulator AlpA